MRLAPGSGYTLGTALFRLETKERKEIVTIEVDADLLFGALVLDSSALVVPWIPWLVLVTWGYAAPNVLGFSSTLSSSSSIRCRSWCWRRSRRHWSRSLSGRCRGRNCVGTGVGAVKSLVVGPRVGSLIAGVGVGTIVVGTSVVDAGVEAGVGAGVSSSMVGAGVKTSVVGLGVGANGDSSVVRAGVGTTLVD